MLAIGEHRVNLRRPAMRRLVDEMRAIRSPPWILILARVRSKLRWLPVRYVQDKNVIRARFRPLRPGECDHLPIWTPCWICGVALTICHHFDARSVDIHAPELFDPTASGDKQDIPSIFRIDLWRDFRRMHMRQANQVGSVDVGHANL